jgi:hypothetical protein
MELHAILQRFNRKERNLLFRAALGAENMRLGQAFRANVARAIGIEAIPADAWWATDFHLNWIAAALAIYCEGEVTLGRFRTNPREPADDGRRLIEGNQEDVDLLIATRDHLIMIEAKGYEAWSNSQLDSKLRRLALLRAEYERLAKTSSRPNLKLHLLLVSPTQPKNLKASSMGDPWIRKDSSTLSWMCLDIPAGETVLTVERCDETSKVTAHGQHWMISEVRRRSERVKPDA